MAQDRSRRRLPAALRREDANLRAILDTTTDAIVVVDGDGIICFVNRAAEELFARKADDLLGDVFGFPLVAGTTVELDVLRPGDGLRGAMEGRVVEMRTAAIEWEQRPACLASLRDITDRKDAEAERAALMHEQIARAEAEAALHARDEFLAATTHELKTPLTRLRLSLQRARRRIARETPPPPEYIEDALRQIDTESEHVSRLVADLLRLPWIENGAFQLHRSPTDLGQLVRAVTAHARTRTGEEKVLLRVPQEPVVAQVDRRLLEQLMSSAIGNGIRASPPRQPVEVELVVQQDAVPAGDGPATARLSVRDYGTPLPVEDPPRLFGRSFQVYSNAYASGLGLWLHVGREVMRLHGGHIGVEYPADGGTRVVLDLPLA
jgi:signal transduction histidine kinase